MPSLKKSPRILIVRRDNIGDLVCTTPLIRALRERYPDGWIGVLANSYNAPVLDGNPDVDEVFVYTKAKHRGPSESLFGIFRRRLAMMARLRAMRLDEVILATPAPQPRGVALARWLRPRRIVGFGNVRELEVSLPVATEPMTEVEDVFRIAALHGIDGEPPPCRIVAPQSKASDFTVAIHVSARKPSQRWPAERFVELMRLLVKRQPTRFVLLWSPGSANNPAHPGDDEKAAEILSSLGAEFPIEAAHTETLRQLIAALARCHAIVCADGGAMHVAAGLGLPTLCLFGDSNSERWHPWGVSYRLLQEPSRQVADITVSAVVSAFNELRGGTPVRAA